VRKIFQLDFTKKLKAESLMRESMIITTTAVNIIDLILLP